MTCNNKVMIPLLLTLIMLLSIALTPIGNWSEETGPNRDSDDSPIIDYSLLEESDVGQHFDFAQGRAEVQSTLVIVSQFDGDTSSRWTNVEVASLLFDDMSDMFNEASYGAIEVDGQVVGPVSLGNTDTSYEYNSPGVGTLYRFNDGNGGGGTGVINDALEAWVTIQPEFDFSQFDYLIVLVNGDWWRGLGGGCGLNEDNVQDKCWSFDVDYPDGTDEEIKFKGASLVGENGQVSGANTDVGEAEVWGRIAHEYGHQLGLGHVTAGYNNHFDLMAKLMPGHPSTFTKEGQPGFRDVVNWMDSSRIKTLSPSVETHQLQPLEMDTGPTQALKIPLAGDVYYMVEVRKQIRMDDVDWCSTWGADSNSDGEFDDNECTTWTNEMPDEGVFIYRVNPNDDDEAAGDLPVQGVDSTPSTSGSTGLDDGLFKVGDTFQLSAAGGASVDGAVHQSDTSGKEIFIRIESEFEGSFFVFVEYEKDTLLPPELLINPWDPVPWASVDIWVDSELNEWFKYKYHVDGDDGTPDVGNGDDPWANHVNRLYARVANTGEYDAEDVTIQYYYNDPMGIGDDGDWTLIDQVVETIPAGTTITPYIEWTPVIPGLDPYSITNFHSCLKVIVIPHADEIDLGNNEAQENIKYFETRSSSPFHDVSNEFEVANPFNHSSQVMLEITVDTPGWSASLDWHSLILGPNEVRTNNFSISPPGGIGVGGEPGSVHLTGWYVGGLPDGSLHIIPLGGISIAVTPVEKIDVVLSIDSVVLTEGSLSFTGILIGQGLSPDSMFDSSVALVLTSPTGAEYVVHTELTSSGNDASFTDSIDVMGLEPSSGDWKIQAWYAGDRDHEAGAGDVINFSVSPTYIIVPNYIIDPIYTPTVSWGDDYLGSGTLIYPIYPGTDIAVLYTSPSGLEHHDNLSVDAQGRYSNTFSMNESGTWIVDYSYTDNNGVERSWSESVDVEKESTVIPSVGLLTTMAIIMFSAIIAVRRWD